MAHTATFDAFQHHDIHNDTYDKKHDKGAKMNNNRVFDTLQHANRLKAAGVPEKQAEVQAEMMAEIIEDKLATKNDSEQIKSALALNMESNKKELEIKMELIKKELEIKMESIKKDIIIKLASILGGITVFCFSAATTILGFLITRVH